MRGVEANDEGEGGEGWEEKKRKEKTSRESLCGCLAAALRAQHIAVTISAMAIGQAFSLLHVHCVPCAGVYKWDIEGRGKVEGLGGRATGGGGETSQAENSCPKSARRAAK